MRMLLYPFSLLFGGIVRLRNARFASGQRSWRSPVPTVVVGNLSTGGTGKTPHALMVAEILLQHGKHPAMLSRGYGRKTRGFREVDFDSSPTETGDEPLMMKRRFPELPVFVCESRVEGIQKLTARQPHVQYVVLDDAFQHRALQPHVAIVLLTYASLQRPWVLLPAGDGREPLSALKRAQMVIVTKCPDGLGEAEKNKIMQRVAGYTAAPVFFSTYRYLGLTDAQGKNMLPDATKDAAVLLAGIADPEPLARWLRGRFTKVDVAAFADHHTFTVKQLENVLSKAGDAYIVTTEKDAVRIHEVWPEFLEWPKVLVVSVVPDMGADSKVFEKRLLELLREG